jgi:hypothetical protein
VLAIYLLLLVLYLVMLHPWLMSWGATASEQRMTLTGDQVPPEQHFTRAITIKAPTPEVWAWVVQIGQDRAGFYSNTWLENLTGADIHNRNLVLLITPDPYTAFGLLFLAIMLVAVARFLRSRTTRSALTYAQVAPGGVS